MARRSQSIKIVVHTVADMEAVFNRDEVMDFWVEKALEMIRKSGLNEEEKKELKKAYTKIEMHT